MFKNFRLLVVQLLFIGVIAFLLEKFWEFPQWINYIIPASCFIVFFLGIQIKEGINKIDNTISSDGIAGARLLGIFLNSILLPWCLGWFHNMYFNIFMLIGSVYCTTKGKGYFKDFFCKNNWRKEYWYVFGECILMISGIYSVLSYYGLAPCGVVNVYIRALLALLFLVVSRISLPPNTWLAKFATKNYERYK